MSTKGKKLVPTWAMKLSMFADPFIAKLITKAMMLISMPMKLTKRKSFSFGIILAIEKNLLVFRNKMNLYYKFVAIYSASADLRDRNQSRAKPRMIAVKVIAMIHQSKNRKSTLRDSPKTKSPR
jgi:hypothetical protein